MKAAEKLALIKIEGGLAGGQIDWRLPGCQPAAQDGHIQPKRAILAEGHGLVVDLRIVIDKAAQIGQDRA